MELWQPAVPVAVRRRVPVLVVVVLLEVQLEVEFTCGQGVVRERFGVAEVRGRAEAGASGGEIVERPAEQHTITKRYTEEALSFIEDSGEQPFFLYLPYTFPHVPLYASDEFEGRSARGLYGDVVEEIDWSTGQIVDKLQDQKQLFKSYMLGTPDLQTAAESLVSLAYYSGSTDNISAVIAEAGTLERELGRVRTYPFPPREEEEPAA